MTNSQTKLNAIFGDPVNHSKSPQLHSWFYQQLAVSDQYTFLAFPITSENLQNSLLSVRTLGINGLAITIPHKQKIIEYLDEISPTAKMIGAVNTVRNLDGILVGENTDWLGASIPLWQKSEDSKPNFLDQISAENIIDSFQFLNSQTQKKPNIKLQDLLKKLPKPQDIPKFLEGKKVALIGAGGAASGILYSVLKAGSEVVILNRTIQKAEDLKEQFNQNGFEKIEVAEMNNPQIITESDVIINATSVGLKNPEESPIDTNLLNSNQIIFDSVYHNQGTKLITEAERIGAKTVAGLEMLFWQGVYQCKIHLGL